MVERHGVGPSIVTGGSQYTVIRARQNLASLRFGKHPLMPAYFSKRHLPQPSAAAPVSRSQSR
jgi:hypothetical protein